MIPSILGTLAVITAGVGLALTLVFASPLFLTLMLASVAFALVAGAVYLSAKHKPETDPEQVLTRNFRQLPEDKVTANFLSFFPHNLWQNKYKPSLYLALPEDTSMPYSYLFPVLYKSNKPTTHSSVTTSHRGVLANMIGPDVNTINENANALSETLYSFFNSYEEGDREWMLSTAGGDTSHSYPFAPTETRLGSVTMSNHVPPQEKPRCPQFLAHVRGPWVSDFIHDSDQGLGRYFLRAKESYLELLNTASQTHSSLLMVPLFSALDNNALLDSPDTRRLFGDTCLAALVEAVNEFALSNKDSTRLTVCLQQH